MKKAGGRPPGRLSAAACGHRRPIPAPHGCQSQPWGVLHSYQLGSACRSKRKPAAMIASAIWGKYRSSTINTALPSPPFTVGVAAQPLCGAFGDRFNHGKAAVTGGHKRGALAFGGRVTEQAAVDHSGAVAGRCSGSRATASRRRTASGREGAGAGWDSIHRLSAASNSGRIVTRTGVASVRGRPRFDF